MELASNADFFGQPFHRLQRGSGVILPAFTHGKHDTKLTTHSLRLPKAIQLRQGADEQAVAGHRRGGHAHLVEGICAQQRVFGAGLEDKGAPSSLSAKSLPFAAHGEAVKEVPPSRMRCFS